MTWDLWICQYLNLPRRTPLCISPLNLAQRYNTVPTSHLKQINTATSDMFVVSQWKLRQIFKVFATLGCRPLLTTWWPIVSSSASVTWFSLIGPFWKFLNLIGPFMGSFVYILVWKSKTPYTHHTVEDKACCEVKHHKRNIKLFGGIYSLGVFASYFILLKWVFPIQFVAYQGVKKNVEWVVSVGI